MTLPVDPTRRAGKTPTPRRRRTDAMALPAAASDQGKRATEIIPVETPPASPQTDPVFAAQILGQDGQRRGLKGGPELLQKAQATYLGAEWSGGADRRAKKGAKAKTEI